MEKNTGTKIGDFSKHCMETYVDIVEEEFGKENQNGRIIIFDIKYEFHSEVGHNQKQ